MLSVRQTTEKGKDFHAGRCFLPAFFREKQEMASMQRGIDGVVPHRIYGRPLRVSFCDAKGRGYAGNNFL